MTACPTCGHDPDAKPRTELEREYPSNAAELQRAADQTGEEPREIGHGCIGWRGLVWHRITCRKATTCVRSGRAIAPGEAAWRQLSLTRGRDDRVADAAWQDSAPPAPQSSMF